MGRRPRGRVLIINNKIFFGPLEEDENGKKRVTLATREGTEQDERKIQEVFEQMFFVVDVHMDKKGEVSTGKPIEWKNANGNAIKNRLKMTPEMKDFLS